MSTDTYTSQEAFIALLQAGLEGAITDRQLQWWEIGGRGDAQLVCGPDTPENRAEMERWAALLPERNTPLTGDERREFFSQ